MADYDYLADTNCIWVEGRRANAAKMLHCSFDNSDKAPVTKGVDHLPSVADYSGLADSHSHVHDAIFLSYCLVLEDF